MAKFIETTIDEAFPVFYGHVNQKSHKCGEAEGPHYAPGSKWYLIDCSKNRRFAEFRANGLRRDGYTVTVKFPN